jgi:hypothetical protein
VQLRDDVKLLPGERLEREQDLEIVDPPATPDPLEELCKLAGVERPEEVGRNGPLIAARATDANPSKAALRLFEIVYGRDSLVAALFVGDLFPLLREATVLYLAQYQGERYDAWHEEEPGRMAHMIRDPNPEEKLGYPYYGSVDATPHFITAAMHAIQARPTFEAEIRHALDGAVAWLLRRLATDELGLLSHQSVNPHGIANQVWKDSWDSMSHADGTVANHAAPVASLEAQALAYDALAEVGELHAADRLARSVEKHFWLGDFYAIGSFNVADKMANGGGSFSLMAGSTVLDSGDVHADPRGRLPVLRLRRGDHAGRADLAAVELLRRTGALRGPRQVVVDR